MMVSVCRRVIGLISLRLGQTLDSCEKFGQHFLEEGAYQPNVAGCSEAQEYRLRSANQKTYRGKRQRNQG